MAAAPLILLTIVAVLDVLFLINFFFVRRVRISVEKEEAKTTSERDSRRSNESSTLAATATTRNGLEAGVGYIYRFLYAIFYDDVYREANQVLEFPRWRKKWLAIASTSFLVVGSSFVMSPQLILSNSDLSPLIKNAAPDFCLAKSSKLDDFRDMLMDTTQIDAAQQQSERLAHLHSAFQHDLSQYGESSYPCYSAQYGTKAAYQSAGMDRTNGPYFPGSCPSALAAGIALAQTDHCSQKVCANVTTSQLSSTWAKQCVDTITTCPAQTTDALPELSDYHAAQLESVHNASAQAIHFAEDFADDHGETYDRASTLLQKLLHQVDVASTAYVFYSCIALLFPAPILLHRSPIRSMVNRFFIGVNRYQFIGLVLLFWWTFEYYDLIWFSPQLRLYAINMLRDPCFVDAEYWVERQAALDGVCSRMLGYVNNFDVFGPSLRHMVQETTLFANDCCSATNFPYNRLSELASLWGNNGNNNDHILNELGFDTVPDFVRPFGRVLFPNPYDFAFAGNATLCSDILTAERIVLATPPEVTYNLWDLWIKSGLIASLLFKIALANFGLALYWLADPLSRCGGAYEYPREQPVDVQTGLALKEKTLAGLNAISMKWAIIWFIIVKMCLANLFAATDLDDIVWDNSDPLVYAATVLAATGLCVALVFALAICIVSRYGARTLIDWTFATFTCGAIRCRGKQERLDMYEGKIDEEDDVIEVRKDANML